MNEQIRFALKVGLITLGVLLMTRAISQQVGYGFVNGVVLATKKAEKDERK